MMMMMMILIIVCGGKKGDFIPGSVKNKAALFSFSLPSRHDSVLRHHANHFTISMGQTTPST
jgi:hypothetical protein